MNIAWEKALREGDAQTVRALLAEGANVDARDGHGQTGLMLAAHAGHREVVETLLAHGADLNITGKFSLSALMLAIIAGQPEIASLLARSGADLAVQGCGSPGFAGKTALVLAQERDMRQLMTELQPNRQTR